ncbi:MAG: hypothetical protein FWG64_00145 [Firmicutes bacterium]|nr:hypothetical protein [Bacillota bacterium]
MRKIQQKQIFDTLEIIKDAQIAKNYTDCQEGALALCDFIESITNKGEKTVNLLEKYCELLFNANSGNIGETALQVHFNSIVKSVREELKPTRLEIAFISHISAMSDTMETIYKAAKADPNCDAYWIPVPYYEVTPTGETTEKLFEPLDNYSEDFELTDWQTYDIEVRQPDVIFHYNLYDETTITYRIHSNFYNKRLQKFTDMLVYIPYFAQESLIESHEYMLLLGCIFSHKVIVPSQKLKEEYFDTAELSKNKYPGIVELYNANVDLSKRPNYGNIDNSSKYIALGSPKYDKVMISERNQFELPTNWKDLTKGKKVILYNTTLTTLIENDVAQYLQKISATLNFFADNTSTILWWRPHPLMLALLSNSFPNYFETYQNIVDNYKSAAYGIFDDTPNLHRAIACTDGYYGDKNSLLHLYAVSGKPLILQDVTFNNSQTNNQQNIDHLKNVFFPQKPQTTAEELFHHENENLQLHDLYNFALHGDYTQADILAQQKATIKIFGLPEDDLSGNLIYNYVKTETLDK